MSERDDVDLVRAAQAGDRGALDALLRAHVDRIHAICRRLRPDPSDADDATQDAMIAVVRGLPRFDGRSAFSTWVHRVTTNSCLDGIRRQQRRPRVVRTIGEAARDGTGATAGSPLDPADPEAGPDARVPDRMALDDALAALAEEFRAPVVLRDQLGFDYAEIAEVLGVPPGTVRSRIARGRRRLAELLDDGSDDGRTAGNPTAGGDVQGATP